MPTNLSPEYKTAEAAYKSAREPMERLACLREMLRSIPKHKGTERLQADIKTRIKHLSEELAAPKKAGGGGPQQVVRAEGAAQIALLGGANVGKSTLHMRLTGSHADTGPYPYTTHEAMPGMLSFEDIHFQLVDLPPLTRMHPVPWIGNALQPADGCMLVVDLQDPECVEQVQYIVEQLGERRITLVSSWEPYTPDEDDPDYDPFALRLPTLLIVNKLDQLENAADELSVFFELLGTWFPALEVSATEGTELERIAPWLFRALHVVRVYTKAPGRPADKDQPFAVRVGDTVHDVALLVHRDIADSLKFAKVWGSGHFDGQQVGRDHPVSDGDILELH
jgi:ribosome-interacting GTPase 1